MIWFGSREEGCESDDYVGRLLLNKPLRAITLLTRAPKRDVSRLMFPPFYDNCKLSCRGNIPTLSELVQRFPSYFMRVGWGAEHEVDGRSTMKRVEDGGS